MNRYKLLFFVSLVLIGAMLTIYFVIDSKEDSNGSKQTVVIDNFKVFEKFELKKDYDKKIEKEFALEKASLDSMGNAFNTLKSKFEVDALKKQFAMRKGQFDQKFQTISQQYTSEVYTRLNEYIKEYGKKNGYGIIIGSNGQGNVMYIDDAKDVTEELIKFINHKYSNE
ncbi:periplasmic chaperone [compost metagenome]